MDFNFNSINIMDQNNIILILLLIAVLVAFYAIYLAMENSKRIKKVSLEMVDLAKLIQESSSMPTPNFLQRNPPPEHPFPNQREDLDEYPTLEEVNNELNEQVEEPLDENLKNQINNLDNLDEEALLNLERQLDAESKGLENTEEARELEDVEEENIEEENEEEENVEEENVEEENVEEEQSEDEEESNEVTNETVLDEENTNEYPVLGQLTEDGLNELNCEELREICKREELRTRGRKAELVERIVKKRDALA